MGGHQALKGTAGPRAASPDPGGGGVQLTLGWGVRGTTGPRVSCPMGQFRGEGTSYPTTPAPLSFFTLETFCTPKPTCNTKTFQRTRDVSAKKCARIRSWYSIYVVDALFFTRSCKNVCLRPFQLGTAHEDARTH